MKVLNEISNHDDEGHLPSLAQKRVNGYNATLFIDGVEMGKVSSVSVPVIQKPRRRDCLGKGFGNCSGVITCEVPFLNGFSLKKYKLKSIKNGKKGRFGIRSKKKIDKNAWFSILGL